MSKNKNIAAGIFFYASNTNRFLFLLRNDGKETTYWGIPGGKLEKNETIIEGLERECHEEIQFFPVNPKLIPIQKFVNNTFTYHTFFCPVETEFLPILNEEHIGYCWVDVHNYPKPLHPGLFNTVNFDVVKDKLEQLTKVKE
jgi:8-oxo-dGTP pyrophosphatase MutT (NUDIX family)